MTIITQIIYCKSESEPAIRTAVEKLRFSGAKSVLVLACSASFWCNDVVLPWFKELPVRVFGGVFPYVVLQGEVFHEGCLLVGLNVEAQVHVLQELNGPPSDWYNIVKHWREPQQTQGTVITFVDGFAKQIEQYLDVLYSVFGCQVSYAGGGAGSLDAPKSYSLITPSGMLHNAAIAICLSKRAKVGKSHGWQPFAGPFLVTSVEGNRIYTLNYKPALQVYKSAIESNTNLRFEHHNFFEIAKEYPFGIANVDSQFLVREAVSAEGNALVSIGNVPANSVVYLLQGKPERLIASAAEAVALTGSENEPLGKQTGAFLFDCVSRYMYLKSDFRNEIEQLQVALGGNSDMVGALTIGEICSSKAGPPEFLNKSIVVSIFQ